jgi:alpha-glucuronidase
MRLIFVLGLLGFAAAENGLNGWLRYASLPSDAQTGATIPSAIVALNSTKTSPVYVAGQELQNGIQGILGKGLNISSTATNVTSTITVGTIDAFVSTGNLMSGIPELEDDGFYLDTTGPNIQIAGKNERGALYGTFEYLSMLAQGNFTAVSYASNPSAPIRWVNHWDNLDGSIERGFAGTSIFFKGGQVVSDLTRVSQYARLLASIRVNGIVTCLIWRGSW